jgi:hypothetical protein
VAHVEGNLIPPTLIVSKGAVPVRRRGPGHMAPTWLSRSEGIKIVLHGPHGAATFAPGSLSDLAADPKLKAERVPDRDGCLRGAGSGHINLHIVFDATMDPVVLPTSEADGAIST